MASATAIVPGDAAAPGTLSPPLGVTRANPPSRRWISPITRRILAVNFLALAFLLFGMLYLDEYRNGLVEAELATLRSEANLFAAALGEGATSSDPAVSGTILPAPAQQLVRRLVEASGVRARLFDDDGELIADSQQLIGPGGVVQIHELPLPRGTANLLTRMLNYYDRTLARLWRRDELPVYTENINQTAGDYSEVTQALAGKTASQLRANPDGGMILSVAVPVQRYKQVLGALMLTKGSASIDDAVFKVRLDIVKWFLVALAVTVLLSLYLAGTIARPILKLAAAAEGVRRDRHRQHALPDFGRRRDEIGQLAGALRDMTQALWSRIDAIERFAADVAHEIKNPLSSLRSAVETVERVEDPERRRKLMTIIVEDVGRLDRLITDISQASRLDAALSREDAVAVDLGKMLAMLIELSALAAEKRGVGLVLEMPPRAELTISGLEGRLVQVFRNLIANALSFSPPGGTITVKAARADDAVVIEVLDEGPGIPVGRENDIFLRFYSQRPQSEKFGVHSGLGLSISKQIVEAHGGSVVAENRRRADGTIAGARFIVRLPVE